MRPWRAGRTHRQFVRLSTPRLARTAAGEVYGWGRADSSQLGLGSGAEATEARDTPVRVPGLGLANPNPNPNLIPTLALTLTLILTLALALALTLTLALTRYVCPACRTCARSCAAPTTAAR